MPAWYILLDGPLDDLNHLKRLFAASNFTFDEMDGKPTLSASTLELMNNKKDVIDAGMELLATINTVLRLSVVSFTGFNFHGLIEKRDGKTNRTMIASGGHYSITGVSAVGMAGFIGKPVRTREERLVALIAKMPEIADISLQMSVRPLTWGAMNSTYESVKGLMSLEKKIAAKKKDHEGLVRRGWLTDEESRRFYHTAAYHRHGYPKEPIRGGAIEMPMHEATTLTKRLFWRMVDELQPE